MSRLSPFGRTLHQAHRKRQRHLIFWIWINSELIFMYPQFEFEWVFAVADAQETGPVVGCLMFDVQVKAKANNPALFPFIEQMKYCRQNLLQKCQINYFCTSSTPPSSSRVGLINCTWPSVAAEYVYSISIWCWRHSAENVFAPTCCVEENVELNRIPCCLWCTTTTSGRTDAPIPNKYSRDIFLCALMSAKQKQYLAQQARSSHGKM